MIKMALNIVIDNCSESIIKITKLLIDINNYEAIPFEVKIYFNEILFFEKNINEH
jgi:hypothetical protein